MASKTRDITIVEEGGTFNALLRRFSKGEKYDFEGLAALRRVLSNQRAKLMHVIKKKSPLSIYALAKLLKRDFKSVFEDISLLKKFGFVDVVKERTGKRERLRPVLVADTITIRINL